ncbi:MAG TPA: glutamine-hydrolyzing carbamoyl-phosphate synthase small subunit [bacterium]|nr:glutamine-hydrolyzing carbamoyl-phosphate synthase small subunit [bacterium]
MNGKAIIALEDGTVFHGSSFGASGERAGEVVFNTSMTGYQEILTDPSYKGQIVTMTYTLIGNYGVNEADCESWQPWVEGFVVKEYSKIRSNWRSEESLSDFLNKYNIIGIERVDTRALTRHIRERGAMKAVISTIDLDPKSLVRKAKKSAGLIGRDLVREVTYGEVREWSRKGKYRVAAIDCGIKYNILRLLESHGCKVTVFPAGATAEEIKAIKPDGLFLSNGPGDPEAVSYVYNTVEKLVNDGVPTFGICLGHQMLGLALGGKTYKLKFGHRGANHPVKNLKKNTVEITVQNHGFCVDIESLDERDVEVTHINLNDGTLEGMRHKKLPVFSVQYHPEASPGPHDSVYLFKDFTDLMEKHRAKKN